MRICRWGGAGFIDCRLEIEIVGEPAPTLVNFVRFDREKFEVLGYENGTAVSSVTLCFFQDLNLVNYRF